MVWPRRSFHARRDNPSRSVFPGGQKRTHPCRRHALYWFLQPHILASHLRQIISVVTNSFDSAVPSFAQQPDFGARYRPRNRQHAADGRQVRIKEDWDLPRARRAPPARKRTMAKIFASVIFMRGRFGFAMPSQDVRAAHADPTAARAAARMMVLFMVVVTPNHAN
jgi:hypothetical protein